MARAAVAEVAHELSERRRQLGLSQSAVAAAAGVSQPSLSRIERGLTKVPPLDDLSAIAAVLGLGLRLNAFPGGEPVHDHVQVRLLAVVHDRVHAQVAWRTEVALAIEGDRRAWDAVAFTGDGWTAIEVIGRLGAVDATVRTLRQKQRDDPRIRRVVLVAADTRRNRTALAAARSLLAAEFPLPGRHILRALAGGRTPEADGILLLAVPAKTASPAPRPDNPQLVHIGGKVVDRYAAATLKVVDNPVGAGVVAP